MARVDCRLRRVPLDDAFAGRHLGTVVVRHVGLQLLAFSVAALLFARQEVARGLGLLVQRLDAPLAACVTVIVIAAFVAASVQLDHLACGLVQAIGAVAQLRVRAASLFAGVGGQLHPVDGEHLPPDQALPVAGDEHLREQRQDLLAQFANELGNVRVARLRVAADRHEQYVLATGLLDSATGDHAPAVSQQHDLEHHPRVVRAGACLVIAKARIQRRQVQLVVH